jgi:hypothetical protein
LQHCCTTIKPTWKVLKPAIHDIILQSKPTNLSCFSAKVQT